MSMEEKRAAEASDHGPSESCVNRGATGYKKDVYKTDVGNTNDLFLDR